MAYGKYRHSIFYGEKGSTWNVEIWKDGYSGSSSEIDLSGEGFEITWNGQGGTRDRVFLGSECKLNCIVKDGTDESFLYDTIESGYQEYFIRIYRGAVSNANLWWYGWIQPAFDKLENLPFPYVFQITATDSYGFWSKQKEKTFADDTERNTAHSVRDILFTMIDDMDLRKASSGDLAPVPHNFNWCRTSLDWYREGETNTSGDPAKLYKAAKGFVNNTPTEDGDSFDSAFRYKPCDVFNGVLKAFNTIGFLAEGHYNFIQPNSLANNTSGNITVFEYNSALIPSPSNSFPLNTLLTIDQSSNVILGGSTITYEPSFESVSVNFKGGFSNFNITPGQLLNTAFYAGSLQSGLTGNLNLVFRAEYYERLNSINLSTSHSVDGYSYRTTGVLKIVITDGSTTKYLKQTAGSGVLTWENTESSINVYRGYAINDTLPVNNTSYMVVGNTSVPFGQIGSPTRMYSPSSGSIYYKFWTQMDFDAVVEQPPITGDVYIEFQCSNYYYQRNNSTEAVIPLPGSQPTPTETSITCQEIELSPGEYNEENNVSDGVTYTATQDNNDAIEQFDLGDVKLGKSLINDLSSIKYGSGNDIVSGFRRGTSGDFKNPSVLLVSEFLELQVDPLEILQADIQSADISPLKLIKYSINGNSNFNYYSFLGGTFKAQSEILSGEWFRVSSVTSNFDDQEYYSGLRYVPSTTPTQQGVFQQNFVSSQMLDNNSYGSLNADLDAGTSSTRVTLSANSKGKIYSGQKLVLTYPDGSNPLILTASGDTATSSSVVDLASFTAGITYPAGSRLNPLLYDFTNVITGGGGSGTPGGSDTQVQFNDSGSFNGTDLLKVTGANELTIGGTNSNILFNSGADLVLGADTAGGTSSTIQYLDSGSTARVMLGAYATDVVVLSNRAANGEVQIRANTSAGGGAGELIIATFKDTSVDFLDAAELRGTNIGTIYNLEAYLTAVDFCMTSSLSVTSATSTNGGDSDYNNASVSSYATFQVPKGYEATHVQVYGSSSSSTFDVYSCSVTNATTTALTSSPSVNSNQALSTAFLGEPSKYLSIRFNAGATRRQVYGAKITLARV